MHRSLIHSDYVSFTGEKTSEYKACNITIMTPDICVPGAQTQSYAAQVYL